MTGTKMARTITAVTINNYDDYDIADNDICIIKDNGNNWNDYSTSNWNNREAITPPSPATIRPAKMIATTAK